VLSKALLLLLLLLLYDKAGPHWNTLAYSCRKPDSRLSRVYARPAVTYPVAENRRSYN